MGIAQISLLFSNIRCVLLNPWIKQPEIRWHMRPCLVISLSRSISLSASDRDALSHPQHHRSLRSRRIVYVKHYSLLAVLPSGSQQSSRMPRNAFRPYRIWCKSAVTPMTSLPLSRWNTRTLYHPVDFGSSTAEAWLRLMCCGAYSEDQRVQDITRFLMEITLFYREFVFYTPQP